MPRAIKKAGTFQRNAWSKMIDGKRLHVHCRDLGLPEDQWTEIGSYQAAIAYWERLFPTDAPKPTPAERVQGDVQTVLDQIGGLDGLLRLVNQGKAANELAAIVGKMPEGKIPTVIATPVIVDSPEALPTFAGPAVDHIAKLKTDILVKTTDTDKTLAHWQELWLADAKLEMRPKPYGNILYIVARWKECPFLAPMMDVGSITWETVRLFRHWADELKTIKKDKVTGQHKRVSKSAKFQQCLYFKAFCNYLWKHEQIELPRNLDLLTINVPKVKVKPVTLDNVRTLLGKIKNDMHRLYCLLVLNTGMNNCDIAALTPDMIVNGLLTRKRVKTSEEDNVPDVTYKLWPETIRLLEKYGRKGDLLLLSSADTPLYRTWFGEDGKPGHTDLIGQQWARAKYPITLENLRKYVPQAFKRLGYAEFTDYYLGQSAGMSVARSFYAGDESGQNRFFNALDLIAKELGLAV